MSHVELRRIICCFVYESVALKWPHQSGGDPCLSIFAPRPITNLNMLQEVATRPSGCRYEHAASLRTIYIILLMQQELFMAVISHSYSWPPCSHAVTWGTLAVGPARSHFALLCLRGGGALRFWEANLVGHNPGNMPMRMLGHVSDDSGHDRAISLFPTNMPVSRWSVTSI